MASVLKVLTWIGVVFFQIVMAMAVTFFASFLVPGNETIRSDQPLLFVLFVTVTYTAGVFLGGWLALKLRVLKYPILFFPRLFGALLGAFLPLAVGFIVPSVMQIEGAFHALFGSIICFFAAGKIARPD